MKSKKSVNQKNVFLQDSKNPDRIIAVNPYGTKGVYLYRKAADGSIYPEQKFFDGTIYTTNNGITISPSNSNSSSSKFNLERDKNGNLIDNDSGTKYKTLIIKQHKDNPESVWYGNPDGKAPFMYVHPYNTDQRTALVQFGGNSEVNDKVPPISYNDKNDLIAQKYNESINNDQSDYSTRTSPDNLENNNNSNTLDHPSDTKSPADVANNNQDK
jgi:hypothetical protein